MADEKINKMTVRTMLSIKDYKKLLSIRDAYKFKSIYQLLKCIIQAFIHAVDNIEQGGDIRDEVDEIFQGLIEQEIPS